MGTTSYREKYLTATQTALANLASRNVIRAFDNDNSTGAALKWNSTTTTTSVHEADNKTITSTTTVTNHHPAFFMPGFKVDYITHSNWDTNATFENSWMMLTPCPSTGCKTGGYCDGVWTAGAGYIVITGYPLINEPGL